MILCDKTLKKCVEEKKINFTPPLTETQIQPSSIDLRLDYVFTTYNQEEIGNIDTGNRRLDLSNYSSTKRLKYNTDPYILQPSSFVLAQTLEHVSVPTDMVGVVEGRSSFGRVGLLIHVTAGYIDPGFEGNITLEIGNINNIPIAIYPEQRICQIVFHELDDKCEFQYGHPMRNSKYQFQRNPMPSKINMER